ALCLTLMANTRAAERADGDVRDAGQETLGREGGFELIFHDRYLLWIAVLMVLLNVVNTTGQYILNRLIVGEAAAPLGSGAAAVGSSPSSHRPRTGASALLGSRPFITAYSGSIMAAVNLVGLLLQLFLTSRVIRWIGVRGSLFVLPVIALVNYSIIP